MNELPEELLDKFYLAHGMACEDPEPELMITFFAGEDEQEEYMKLYENENYAVLKEFTEAVWDDAKKCMIAIIDEDKIEEYYDDCE